MKQRRETLRERLDGLAVDALLVTKPVNVRYLTGFSGSNGQVVIGAEEVFMTDPRYEEQSSREVPEMRREIYFTNPKQIGESGGMYGALRDVLAGIGVARIGVEAGHMTLATAATIREKVPGVELVETTDEVEQQRRVKDEAEVEALRTACSFADRALAELLGELREGLSEIEVAAFLEDRMRRAGSEGLSFDTIAAFGEQAAEPHHRPTTRELRSGDLIKLDFGATFGGYHSDMTRTIAFGEPNAEMTEVYELVRASQQAGVDAVRAGATCGDVDAAARGYLNDRGHDFGHGTGHGVGLEVHEAPPVRSGATDVLVPGMAITVEPGIYLPGVGGVRIEDSVIVREDGCDILTASPKELVKV
ncbi:MAG TPA: Xaa-Pro peptidase family protein [Actinomycetota bacterium]